MTDLTAMKTYCGTNPRPADFDMYWARALAQLDAQTTAYRLAADSTYNVPGYHMEHLWFTGVGGAQIHAKVVRPALPGVRLPAVALFHGYTDHCGDWFSKLPYAAAGFVTAAMDVRGQGGLSTDPLQTGGSTHRGHIVRGADSSDPDLLFYRNVFLDTVQLVRILAQLPFVDSARIGAAGSSQGGGLAVACAALAPQVRAVSIGCPFLTDYQRVWELGAPLAPEAAYRELFVYFRKKDPLHEHADTLWQRLGYIDVHHLAPRIQAEALFFTGLQDATCPPESQFAVYNNLAGKKQLCIYPEYGHEIYPGQDDKTLAFFLQCLGAVKPHVDPSRTRDSSKINLLDIESGGLEHEKS